MLRTGSRFRGDERHQSFALIPASAGIQPRAKPLPDCFVVARLAMTTKARREKDLPLLNANPVPIGQSRIARYAFVFTGVSKSKMFQAKDRLKAN